jgi:uncharacterized coiled-coil protein SlyX
LVSLQSQVYEITEDELTELETALTRQAETIEKLQTTISEQGATLTRLSTTIERQATTLHRQNETIETLGQSFNEYERAGLYARISAGVIGAGVGAGLTALVFVILR